MSDWYCVAYNAQSGVSTWHKEEEDGLVVQTRQDMSVLLDENTAQRNMAQSGWQGDYHSVARIPSALFYDKQNPLAEAIRAGDDKFVAKTLNDGDNIKLRTKEGSI